ncbi:hypothetical protein G3495_14070 [Shewanella baltica]|uniref:hypothetical protein n=1 Tax=Shewanella baltica TaxID=62322 RepID=UPI00217DE5BE|nr:hypothetical protein [Shewanella baltica]MCS6236242.1 hypothetical protein [Shewanella baltica]MCS6270645.1 hypothetical protein [Shewanella baltica]
MLDFLPVVFLVITGVGSIVGGTWDSTKQGTEKLTVSGRVAAVTLLCTTFFSFHVAYENYESKQQKEIYKIEISSIISDQVNESVLELLAPFRTLYIENTGGHYLPDEKITLSMLLTPENIKKSQEMCFENSPKTFTSGIERTWEERFEIGISRGVSKLKKLQLVHSNHIDSKLLKSIYDLLDNGIMTSYAYVLPEKKSEKERDSLQYKCLIGQPIGAHEQYLTMIKAIYDANGANESNVFIN